MVKRKEVASRNLVIASYKMLTLKSFEQDGWLKEENLDRFDSGEEIESKYLTTQGDVIIRLSSPYTAIAINEQNENLIIPSLFVVIRLASKKLLSEFLALYLNSDQMKKSFLRESSGSAIKSIRASAFKDFEIPHVEVDMQKKAVEISQLMKKEKKLMIALMAQQDQFNNATINHILNGGLKNAN